MEKEDKSVSAESSETSEVEVKNLITDGSVVEPALDTDSTVTSTESFDNTSASQSEIRDALKSKRGKSRKRGKKWVVKEDYIDIIKDQFWESKPWLLA